MVGKTVLSLSMTAVAALAPPACGSDQNTNEAALTGVSTPSSSPVDCAGKTSLTAEGATSQLAAIALFSQVWGQVCAGKEVSYNPTGSGAGREQFIAGHIDFAGSDSPLTPEQADAAAERCGGNPAWHLPLVLGSIALAYQLDDVDNLVVNGDVLAKIFTGQITTWNDPAIRAINPGAALPDLEIAPIYRSDSSGTTDNFQRYLAGTAPDSWTKHAGSEFSGGVGEGAEKSAGVIQAVRTTPGAIGYVEKGFADRAGMRSAQIDSGRGPVPLTADSAAAAIKAARFETETSNDLRLDLNSLYATKAAGAYPLVMVTYEIVCSEGYPSELSAAVRSFLTVAINDGQDSLSPAGYIPLPKRFTERLTAATGAIQ